MISLSYSRISLRDICLKLHLDSEKDAEYIVAKVCFRYFIINKIHDILTYYYFFQAIRDGVIDAIIDHEKGFMKSKVNNISLFSILKILLV